MSNALTKTIKYYSFLTQSVKALWLLVGLAFASYVYCVGAITFSVIERQHLDRDVKELLSTISAQELEYLAADRALTMQEAYARGLVDAETVSFSARGTGFAFNGNR